MRITKKLDKIVDKYLEIWYLVLNRTCFSNKLPKNLLVVSARTKDLRGFCACRDNKVLGIGIDPRDPELVCVLLHEMVHAYQTHILKYPDKFVDHDHAFWQKLKVAKKQLVRALNE